MSLLIYLSAASVVLRRIRFGVAKISNADRAESRELSNTRSSRRQRHSINSNHYTPALATFAPIARRLQPNHPIEGAPKFAVRLFSAVQLERQFKPEASVMNHDDDDDETRRWNVAFQTFLCRRLIGFSEFT